MKPVLAFLRLNTNTMIEPNNFHDLVNKAVSQENAMKKAQRDKKRQDGFASGSGTNKKFHLVKKNVPSSS
jgi:predicted GIY-YIG superfamily endonuclease